MPSSDLDGDGRNDIIFRNRENDAVMNWLGQPDGGFIFNEASGIDPWGLGELVGLGDINADGRSDTLWRTADGQLYASLTYPDGVFYLHWGLGFVAHVPTEWAFVGMGDFDADGRDDILWRNDVGVLTNWLARGDYVFANNHANTGQAIPLDWQVVGIGDFNGDGGDDLLWRHEGGVVTDWLSQAGGGFANNHVNTGQLIPTDWHVVGTGDFNGDGRDDILWRHDSGVITNWLGQANGGFINNHINTGQLGPTGWRVAGTGDFNGDGRHDILWRHENGDVTDWLGQADGGFVGNPAVYALDAAWLIQPNPGGAGYWDY